MHVVGDALSSCGVEGGVVHEQGVGVGGAGYRLGGAKEPGVGLHVLGERARLNVREALEQTVVAQVDCLDLRGGREHGEDACGFFGDPGG